MEIALRSVFSAKGAVSRQPGASPQESNHPGNQALKARFSSVMVLNPKIPLAQIHAVPMMERMTSRVNRAFSASGFLGAVNPWGDAPG
jgi:hypothetical protein